MILMTFKKYSTDGRSFTELPISQQIPEGGGASSAARGRGISRRVLVEPPVSSPFVVEGSSGAGVNDLEKSGAGRGL